MRLQIQCLIKSLEISPTCPIDRLPLSLSLVIPAPKIINKLVDELLVSCPFKSKLGCSFICQRDLIAAHLRSHQAHLDHPDLYSSIASQNQHPPPSNLTASQNPPPRHVTLTPCPQLRFQWVTGRAVFVPNPSDPPSTSSLVSSSHIHCHPFISLSLHWSCMNAPAGYPNLSCLSELP